MKLSKKCQKPILLLLLSLPLSANTKYFGEKYLDAIALQNQVGRIELFASYTHSRKNDWKIPFEFWSPAGHDGLGVCLLPEKPSWWGIKFHKLDKDVLDDLEILNTMFFFQGDIKINNFIMIIWHSLLRNERQKVHFIFLFFNLIFFFFPPCILSFDCFLSKNLKRKRPMWFEGSLKKRFLICET